MYSVHFDKLLDLSKMLQFWTISGKYSFLQSTFQIYLWILLLQYRPNIYVQYQNGWILLLQYRPNMYVHTKMDGTAFYTPMKECYTCLKIYSLPKLHDATSNITLFLPTLSCLWHMIMYISPPTNVWMRLWTDSIKSFYKKAKCFWCPVEAQGVEVKSLDTLLPKTL